MTTILPAEVPARALPAVGFWASLAVREACLTETGVALDLKWPNDLLWGGRKCGGILSQSRWNGEMARVAVGVGINVNQPERVPETLTESAVWLSEIGGNAVDRTKLLAALLSVYERDFDRLLERPHNAIEYWARIARLAGTELSVKAADGTLLQQGTAQGLDADGALLLRTKTGDLRVTLGDVSAI